MKAFAQLYADLDASTSTQRKCGHMVTYLTHAHPHDAAWAVFFLIGGRVRRVMATSLLRKAACDIAGIADWLFEQSYQAVGDLAETIALLLPAPESEMDIGLAECVEQRVLPLRKLPEEEALQAVRDLWSRMAQQERFLFVKWVGGGLRVGVSRALVIRALHQLTGLDTRILSQRMIAFAQVSQPSASDWHALIAAQDDALAHSVSHTMPYPFFLAHPLEGDVRTLDNPDTWIAEWKYDGIRAQIVRRAGSTHIWSRGEELLNDTFPELIAMSQSWPDGYVLDGEILVMQTANDANPGLPASFASLQVRLGRKRVDAKLQQTHPVVFMAYDLLEHSSADIRHVPQHQRRQQLEVFCQQHAVADGALRLAPLIDFSDWDELAAQRQTSRERGVEGIMLKAKSSAYGVGRTRNDGIWLKWKIEPMSIDAVLVYAQAGHGRRASLYTDYTFAVWDRAPLPEEVTALQTLLKERGAEAASGLPQLVTFAKAYSGLTDEEFKRVDRNIRQNLLEKFGPVRRVVPSMVFEIGFEGIAASGRHKSGVAVRFPRMLRIRDDKPLEQASTLDDLKALLGAQP